MRLRPVVVLFAFWMLACANLDREQGVSLPNQLDEISRGYIRDKGLLQEGETVRAYYDVTVSLDGSEIALITDRRVVYHKDGVTTDLPLADIQDVSRTQEALSDNFLITGRGGQMLQVSIAPMNGGDTWAQVLDGARQGAATP